MSHSSHSSHSSTPTHANVGTMPLNSVNEINGHYNSAYTYDGAASPKTLTWNSWNGDDMSSPTITQSTDSLYELWSNMNYIDGQKGIADTFVQISTTTPEGSYFTYPNTNGLVGNTLATVASSIHHGTKVKALASHLNSYVSTMGTLMNIKGFTNGNVTFPSYNDVVPVSPVTKERLVEIKKTLDDVAEYDYSALHQNHANHQNHASHSSSTG